MDILIQYWPHIVAAISLILATGAAIHAVMTKNEVRAAIGWVGVILLSPILGAMIYMIAGVNRISRRPFIVERRAGRRAPHSDSGFEAADAAVAGRFGRRFAALKTAGDRITSYRQTAGNEVEILPGGDEAYAAMIGAIEGARRSVILQSYIFDHDKVGLRLADALIAAAKRGVEARVLIDAVGARYSRPRIRAYLRAGGVATALFNSGAVVNLRMPYANLRSHRKILVVDGETAFMGGMNIRQGFAAEFAGAQAARDTHFRVRGPAVADILSVSVDDWRFTTKEFLKGAAWRTACASVPAEASTVTARVLPSGPDDSLEANHKLLMSAFSAAHRSIRIMSPYFLPDRELISMLTTAARRGVEVDVVVPAVNNLALVDRAMTAQFDQILKEDCRVWRAGGSFDHSKLLVVDSQWVFAGSSNLDPRSLRLNFEIDLEILDARLGQEIEARIAAAIASAEPVTIEALRARPFPTRLIDRVIWLGSPYL